LHNCDVGSPNSDEEHGRPLRRDPDVAKSACDGEVVDCIDDPLCTDENENQIFLIHKLYKEISGAVTKSYTMRKGYLIYV
jgi:hypothetical protein